MTEVPGHKPHVLLGFLWWPGPFRMARTVIDIGQRAEQWAFIFDMDGVLVDSMPMHVEAWQQVLHAHGVEQDAEEFVRNTAGKTTPQILRELFGDRLSPADIAVYAEEKEQAYRSLAGGRQRPIPGLRHFLESSRALGIPMAVATSAGHANRAMVLDGLQIAEYFHAVIGSEHIRNSKPDPEVFLKAAEALAAPPSRCVVFEDAAAGVEAASRAGMQVVALTTTLPAETFRGHPAVLAIAPDFTAPNPGRLLTVAANVARPSRPRV